MKNTTSKRYIHPNIHSSIIYNSQDVEATQVSTHRWMDKHDVMYICHTHRKKERYSAIKNEIQPFTAMWMDLEDIVLSEMSDRERQILYDITYMWSLKNNTSEQI